MNYIIKPALIIIGVCASALIWAGQTLNNVTISNSSIITGDSNKVVINQSSRSSGGGTSINVGSGSNVSVSRGNSSVVNVNGVSVTVNKDTAEIIIPSHIKTVRVKINNQWKQVLP